MTGVVDSIVAQRCDVIVTASAVAKIHNFHQRSWDNSFQFPDIALCIAHVQNRDG